MVCPLLVPCRVQGARGARQHVTWSSYSNARHANAFMFMAAALLGLSHLRSVILLLGAQKARFSQFPHVSHLSNLRDTSPSPSPTSTHKS